MFLPKAILRFFSIPLFLYSCSSSQAEQNDEDLTKVDYKPTQITVKTEKVQRKAFAMELMSNGKLIGLDKASVPFLLNETIKEVKVQNGQHVVRGQLLALLDQFNYKQELERSRNNMESARLDLANMLLGAGCSIDDTTRIPAKQWLIYKLKSGYTSASLTARDAAHKYEQTFVRAPINGVVTGLEAKSFNPTSAYKNCCVLINDSQMEVAFKVLESEIGAVKKNQTIELVPFAQPELKVWGKVSEINPVVDENGMIALKALIKNSSGKLIDGMNVKVLIKNTIASQLIVPKSAVVIRQGKHVVFTYDNGKAIWNYVTLGLENSSQYTINDGLKKGDEIIVANNFNLAHQAEVKKVKN